MTGSGRPSSLLEAGINSLDLVVEPEKQALMLRYMEMLTRWNQAYNLSGITDPERMLNYHLLDSLSILPFIDGEIILDVGTGAGLPGFILAICFPQKQFILLDSNGKKTRFLFQASVQLGLENIEVVHKRVEDFQTSRQIDIVLSRAFSSLSRFVNWTQHLCCNKTRLLAMKGLYPESEIAELPKGVKVQNTFTLSIPGENVERHLVELVASNQDEQE